jgi:RNA polymerase sigma-70 factor (ECF subfamily)
VDAPGDHELMLEFQGGHAASFDTLYARHRGPLYRYFARQAARATVDDLFQETWLRIIRGKAGYRADASFRAYLYRIAHNVLVDHYRRERHASRPVATEGLDPEDPAPGPEADYAALALRTAFTAALEALPAAQREAFLRLEEAGLTLDQIAHAVGTGRETVKSRLRYAVRRLREALARDREHEEQRA